MKSKLFISIVFLVFVSLTLVGLQNSWAIRGVIATDHDISRLKKALKDGDIEVGVTRLKDVREAYGDASSIISDTRRVVYGYGDLQVTFLKQKLWRQWKFDTFKKRVYTDSVNDLRFDLESGDLVGANISLSRFLRSYGEPTEAYETDEDGGESVFYYGNIGVTFENYYTVSSWRGSDLQEEESAGVLTGTPPVTPPELPPIPPLPEEPTEK